MINKEILSYVEENTFTEEEIIYLLDKLCRIGTRPKASVTSRVSLFLKSRQFLDQVGRDDTASFMNMSPRTLSRKLKKENSGFHKLLDEERQRRCLHYLRADVVRGQEIAELVGLSDISHFYRSFKQWTGYSFSEFKKMMAGNHENIDIIIHRLMPGSGA